MYCGQPASERRVCGECHDLARLDPHYGFVVDLPPMPLADDRDAVSAHRETEA
jgi:hypothetical protein